jgi:hypothetical protein
MASKIEQAKKPTKQQTIDWEPLLAGVSDGRSRIEYGANRNIFSQGESADSLFYLREGKVKLAVTSKQGKEAIVAILGEGDFFGEGCLPGQRLRMATASTITEAWEKEAQEFAALQLAYVHYQEQQLGRFVEANPDEFYCWPILGRKAGPQRFFPESARTTWHKWWVPPARGSAIS